MPLWKTVSLTQSFSVVLSMKNIAKLNNYKKGYNSSNKTLYGEK